MRLSTLRCLNVISRRSNRFLPGCLSHVCPPLCQLSFGGKLVTSRKNTSLCSSAHSSFHTSSVYYGKIVPFLLSDIGEGIMEVTVKEWFVEVGDHVSQFDQICEVQSDKASVTITSRYDGIVKNRHYEVDDIARVGSALVDIELDDGAHESVAQGQVDDVAGSNLTAQLESELHDEADFREIREDKAVLATPVVRRIAAENKIKLSDVIGTGKDGRVLKEDLQAFMNKYQQGQRYAPPSGFKQMATSQVTSSPTQQVVQEKVKPLPEPQSSVLEEDTVVTLRGIRKAMAQTMTESLKIPHFGYCDEIDMSALVELRSRLKGSALLGNVPFSYMPVIIKACSLALKEFPILNSSLLPSGDQIVLKAAHNIGFAMDSPEGLIVPNIKNVQNLNVLEIAAELHRLISLGENGKLSMDDISNGTFSISNIGSIGGTYAKPVILPPQVAIGALGKIQVLPRFDNDGAVVKAHIMNVSWSADHRVIEGAQMCRFSNLLKSYLENPATLILNLR